MEHIITDPQCQTPDSFNAVERRILGFMKDERDMIFVRTAAKITATVLPAAAVLFALPTTWVFALAVPYLAFVFVGFGGRYGLMLHAVGHRSIFNKEHQWVEGYIPWVLGPFLGHTPTSFEAHHVFMHHAENNMLADASSTLRYQRDHFGHFLHYWGRFFIMGYAHFGRYMWLRRRYGVLAKFMAGELAWMAMVATLFFFVNWAATVVVFLIPMALMRWFMMAGNFAQHAFVDLEDADNPFRNSNCITNSVYNHRAYNDGYHVVHHISAGMHWSEMPGYYLEHMDEFMAQDAIVFDGVRDNQHVWFLLMTRNYGKLADCLVNFRGRTHEEKVSFLESRVKPTVGARRGFFEFETAEEVIATKRKKAA